MTTPVRLQLSRKKGFNLQELSRSTNGLEAVNCARPSKWGNPYAVGDQFLDDDDPSREIAMETKERCADLFRAMVDEGFLWRYEPSYPSRDAIATELRGKNLACWCHPSDRCHVDVLLELANAGPTQ